MRSSIPLRLYLAIQFGFIAALPVFIIALFVWFYLMPTMESNIGIRHHGTARVIAGQVSAHLLSGERQMGALANYLDNHEPFYSRRIRDMLDYQCGDGELFETIYISNAADNTIISVGLAQSRQAMHEDFLGLDLSGRSFIQKAGESGKTVWSETFLSTASSRLAVAVTVPITGRFVTAEITLDRLSEFISLLPVQSETLIILLDQSGRIVADSRRKRLGHQLNPATLPLDRGENDFVFSRIDLDGDQHIGAIVNIDRLGWKVLVAQPVSHAFTPLRSAFLAIVVSLVVAFIAALWIAWTRAKSQSSLFQTYAEMAHSIAHGNYSPQWPKGARWLRSRVKEMVDFTESLKEMAQMIDQREKELVASETRLFITLNSIGDAVIATDAEGKVTLLNPMAEMLTGWPLESARGEEITEVFKIVNAQTRKTVANPVDEVLISGKVVDLANHTILIAKDGTEYHIADSGAPIRHTDGKIVGVVLVFRDVTEKVRLEEIMVQSEKMMSVGGLAAGMAHEINNPLSGMLQTAATMANRLALDKPIPANLKAAEAAGTTTEAIKAYMTARSIPRMLETITASGKRVAEIVDNMLSFARKSDSSFSTQHLDTLLDKTLELAATDYDLKKQYDFKLITIVKEYGNNVPAVPCEGATMQQVLLNILSNGAQAMQLAGVKKPQFTLRIGFLEERQMAEIQIGDNGPGMDEVTRKRIFEPFFTTKPVGLGTGLGLSVSYFIVTENHHGELLVESSPENGTNFIIRLPVQN